MRHARQHQFLWLAVLLLDAVAAASALMVAFLIRAHILIYYPLWTGEPVLFPTYAVLLGGSIPIFLGSLYLANAYVLERLRGFHNLFLALTKALFFSTLSIMALAFALRDQTFSRAIIALYLLLSFGGFVLVRLIAHRATKLLRRWDIGIDQAIIVGTGPAAKTIEHALRTRSHLGYRPVGFVRVPEERSDDPNEITLGSIEDLPDLVIDNVIDAVFFGLSLEHAARYEKIIWQLEEVGVTVHLRGDAVGVILSRTFVGDFEGMPLLTIRSTPADPVLLAIKRGIDVTGSVLGLVVLSPLLLMTALAIKITSRGPVFFSQERVSLNGRHFPMHKFRSMYQDAEANRDALLSQNEMTGPVFKIKNDPRITWLGAILRKFSIDELPQLWNVFIGQMSLVGPRPPLPAEVREYQRWQRRRLSMKPGLTCLWQVSGRNDIDFETWMKLDMEYIDNWSLMLDLKILCKTIPVVLMSRGAH